MQEATQQMFKSKVCGSVQEVIFPDFPDDDNTVTTTVTKSRRVSFGTNFIKEFIVGSTISAQCVSEYEQAFSSSDSSNFNSSLSGVEGDLLDPTPPFIPETSKIHSAEPPAFKPPDFDPVEPPKQTTFSRTICFNADSPTVDMEFTEGCISLAKSILDKKNKEMTVIIQAKSKEPKEDRLRKDDVTRIFDGSEVEMSMTRCLKSRENLQEGRRFESESTKIFNKFDDEMSITRCDRGFKMRQSRIADDSDFMMESSKENRLPLDVIMRQLDRDDSDTDLFNPEKSFSEMLNSRSFDSYGESEKLNLNESMDISKDIQYVSAKSQELETPKENLTLCSPNQHLSQEQPLESSNQHPLSETPTQHFPLGSHKEHSALEGHKEDLSSDSPKQFPSNLLSAVSSQEHVTLEGSKLESFLEHPSSGSPKKRPSLENRELHLSLESSKQQFSAEISLEHTPSENPELHLSLETSKQHIFAESPEKNLSLENQEQHVSLENSNQHFASETLEHPPSESDKNHTSMENHELHVSLENNSKQHFPPEISLQHPPSESDRNHTSLENRELHLSFENSKQHLSAEISLEHPPSESDRNHTLSENRELHLPLEGSKQHLSAESPLEQLPSESPEKHPSENPEPRLSLESPKQHFPEETSLEQPSENPELQLSLETPKEHLSAESLEHLPSASPENHTSEKLLHLSLESTTEHPKELATLQTPMQLRDNSEGQIADTPVCALPNITGSDELHPEIVKLPPNEDIPVLEQSHSEPLLMDIKVTETLKEQSKETNCLWTLQDIRYPRTKTPGLLSINFTLLKSSTTMEFTLKKSKKRSIHSCSIITNKTIHFKEERTPIHPEYNQVLQFGFKKQQEFFNDCAKKLTAIKEIPYFLDEINLYTRKINTYLEQMYEILISYPGSVLKGTSLTFRLFSYPMFFSTNVTIDLANLYTLSDTSLSFTHGIKKINEKRIANIFQNCTKLENCLCEFIIRSNKYLIDAEKGTGYVSKRSHIRLLPEELRL